MLNDKKLVLRKVFKGDSGVLLFMLPTNSNVWASLTGPKDEKSNENSKKKKELLNKEKISNIEQNDENLIDSDKQLNDLVENEVKTKNNLTFMPVLKPGRKSSQDVMIEENENFDFLAIENRELTIGNNIFHSILKNEVYLFQIKVIQPPENILIYKNYSFIEGTKTLEQAVKEIGKLVFPDKETKELRFYYENTDTSENESIQEFNQNAQNQSVSTCMNKVSIVLVEIADNSDKIRKVFDEIFNNSYINFKNCDNDNVNSAIVSKNMSLRDLFQYIQQFILNGLVDY